MSSAEKYPITVHLTSRDVPRSIRFYRDRLGFTLGECWPDEKQPLFASLTLGKQAILLGAHAPASEASKWCGDDAQLKAYFETLAQEYEESRPGVGIVIYLRVEDVDAFHAKLVEKGVKDMLAPKTQFYGQRDFPVRDPDGYRLTFYAPVVLESCQSCGMPLADAKPGQMYCGYCSDEKGVLKPYAAVFEGTVQGYFMAMKKMPRKEAERAAKEHLAKMPAWMGNP
jgi:uncharacterized glyoxalase superfamily protein PhnB